MNRYFDRWGRDVYFETSLYLFLVALPIGYGIDVALMFIMLLCYFFVSDNSEKLLQLNNHKTSLFLLLGMHTVLWIGTMYSDNVDVAMGRIERSLPLLILPPILLSLPNRYLKLRNIFYALGTGIVIVMLISWGAIIVDIFSKQSPLKQSKYFFEWIYTDHNLLRAADIHPGYFALILVLCLSTIIRGDFFEAIRRNKLIFFLVVSALLLFLVETSSRMGFVALFLILVLSLYKVRGAKEKWIYIFLFFGLFFTLIKFDYLTNKFQKLVDTDGNIVFERYFRWKEILNVFFSEGNLLFGEGTGDAYAIFNQAYVKGNFELALKENYNAHNQYLEFLVGNGLLGLFIYLATVAHFMVKTKLKGVAMPFFILIVMFSFTESFLVRSKGVMFFSFFYPLLIKYYERYDE